MTSPATASSPPPATAISNRSSSTSSRSSNLGHSMTMSLSSSSTSTATPTNATSAVSAGAVAGGQGGILNSSYTHYHRPHRPSYLSLAMNPPNQTPSGSPSFPNNSPTLHTLNPSPNPSQSQSQRPSHPRDLLRLCMGRPSRLK